MNLRICDGGRERVAPAWIELVEKAFAQGASMREGAEIALADGDRWIAAIAVGRSATGSDAEFLLSEMTGQAAPPSGRVSRSEALRRFREFVLE